MKSVSEKCSDGVWKCWTGFKQCWKLFYLTKLQSNVQQRCSIWHKKRWSIQNRVASATLIKSAGSKVFTTRGGCISHLHQSNTVVPISLCLMFIVPVQAEVDFSLLIRTRWVSFFNLAVDLSRLMKYLHFHLGCFPDSVY